MYQSETSPKQIQAFVFNSPKPVRKQVARTNVCLLFFSSAPGASCLYVCKPVRPGRLMSVVFAPVRNQSEKTPDTSPKTSPKPRGVMNNFFGGSRVVDLHDFQTTTSPKSFRLVTSPKDFSFRLVTSPTFRRSGVQVCIIYCSFCDGTL